MCLAKQCYNCQGLGHVQADCPTLRLNGGSNGRCYNCSQVGHLAVSPFFHKLDYIADGEADISLSSATVLSLLPVLVALLLPVEDSPVVSVVDSVVTLALPPATNAVALTTSLVTARLRL